MPRHGMHHAIKKPAQKHADSLIVRLIFFVAITEPLTNVPQIVTIYRLQDASGVSIASWASYAIFGCLWLWYGLTVGQKPIIISGAMFVTTDLIVVVGALLFGGKFI